MPSSARSAMRFRRLRLWNWRNFVDIDVELQRRAFLVGANASGKSNLLDVSARHSPSPNQARTPRRRTVIVRRR